MTNKPTEEEKVAKKLTKELLSNLNDRGGFDLGDIDNKTMNEWRKEWQMIIQRALTNLNRKDR